MLWELCTVLGIARQHEALADVLARTAVAGFEGSAVLRCQAEVRTTHTGILATAKRRCAWRALCEACARVNQARASEVAS